jgi:hypothetical protein
MSNPLSKDGKKRLRKASREPVATYFQSLSSTDRRKKWLHTNNRYRLHCTHRYDCDLKAAPPTVDHAALTAYLAASGPCHVIDGWSFIGRAIDATLRGDSYTAIHLGYYAELRAAMSLLACEGVAILSRRHATVEASGTTHEFSKTSTHAVVWPCIKHWAGLAKANALLEASFRPANVALATWLTTLKVKVPARAIADHWLRCWGIDLAQYDQDHDARNLVSYRPSEFRPPRSDAIEKLCGFVEDLWKCFEPSEGNRFPVIERHLLRRALVAGKASMPLAADSLDPLGLQKAEAATWLAILNGHAEPIVFSEAETQSRVEDERCHLQVISRAALLLYLATAAARWHLAEAGYTRKDLEFWWARFGTFRGLWNNVDKPANPLDLWADILQLLRDNNEFITNSGAGLSLKSWRQGQCRAVEFMGAYELVAIWGLLP